MSRCAWLIFCGTEKSGLAANRKRNPRRLRIICKTFFFFFFFHWGGPLGRCMHYWAWGWPLCSLEECTNRSLVSRELHAHVCTVQAWNTLFRAVVAFSHSVFLFIRSLRNLERIIPTFQTPTSQKAAVASRDQSQEEKEPTSLKWDGKFLYRPWLNAIGWLCTVPETD